MYFCLTKLNDFFFHCEDKNPKNKIMAGIYRSDLIFNLILYSTLITTPLSTILRNHESIRGPY